MTRSMFRAALSLFVISLGFAVPANAGALVEPRLTLHSGFRQQPQVALTLDACSGKTDARILAALIQNRIPATVFVTGRWLKRNPDSMKVMLANRDLFEIENHGAQHVPAVDVPMKVFGIQAAGSADAVRREITGGASAVLAATGLHPLWFRGATGKYTSGALRLVLASGEAVAGYSLIADDGARLSSKGVERRLSHAQDGDVIIAHFNHPEKTAGAGLIQGILALKSKGFVFVKLGKPNAAELPSHHGS